MISPSPTQQPQPSEQRAPEEKKEKFTPARIRTGETPTAQFFKRVFRPPIKGIYYFLRAIKGHKLVTLIMLLLIIGSAVVANYAVTKQWPFGIGYDQFNFHVRGGDGGGDQVKNWLYALRDGDSNTMRLVEKYMRQPPDPSQLIPQFSQTSGHSWKSINVIGVYPEADGTIDSFVQIDLSSAGPGGETKGIVIWHFVTVSQGGGIIIGIDLVASR